MSALPDVLNPESYAMRVARRFRSEAFARIGLRIIIVLFIVAALAPFLANSHALVRVADGHVSFPIFPSMEPIEWRFFLYVPLAGAIWAARRLFLRMPQLDFGVLVLLYFVMEAIFRVFLIVIYPWESNPLSPPFLYVSPGFFAFMLLAGFAFLAYKFRAGFFRLPRLDFTSILLVIVAMEIIVAHIHPVNDPSNDRDRPASFKLMPPVPYSPIESTSDQFAPPSWKHLCGTDLTGRDIAARLLHGARTSLSIGFVSQSISLLVGVSLGGLAGYYRGWTDILVCRFIEIMDCFPPLLLILVAITVFQGENNMFYIMAVIGLTSWTGTARLVRGEFLRLSGQQFALAARAVGASDRRIFVQHLLPNALGPILVTGTFGVASAILIESSLSFLGFGMQAPTPSWGDVLSEARSYIDFAWWLAFFPSIAILVTIMSYNFVGEGLRDAVDPRIRLK